MSLIRKRKLTKRQSRRINEQQKNNQIQNDSELLEGLIVTHFGKQLDVQLLSMPDEIPQKPVVAEGEPEPFFKPLFLNDVWRCHTRTNLPLLTTGDRVRVRVDCNTGLGMIEAVHERHSLITRPDRYHKVKPVVANVDVILIVFAPLPVPSNQLIDRYIVACHHAGIEPILVLNKSDLLSQVDDGEEIKQTLTEYQQLGYKTLTTCIDDKESLVQLTDIVKDKTVVFLGQSGVGKSSLINALNPESMQKVNEISDNSDLGQHTTTATRLIPFMGTGALIDSPGIREFGIWHLETENVIDGFTEIHEFADNCKYRDCKHVNEPKCAVKQAVADGDILERRYESLLALREETAAE